MNITEEGHELAEVLFDDERDTREHQPTAIKKRVRGDRSSEYAKRNETKHWQSEAEKAYMREYRKKNRARIREQQRKWRREKVAGAVVVEGRTKLCTVCGKAFQVTASVIADGYSKCAVCRVPASSRSRATRRVRALRPEQARAHWAVWNHIRSGKLQRQPCSVCGKKKADAHHRDYSKPLEVEWLCRQCHADRHHRHRIELRKTTEEAGDRLAED